MQSPPIYTDSVASRNESFHLFYVHSEYLETTEIHNEPTDVSLSPSPSSSHSLTTSLSVKVVLSLAGPQGALTNHLVSFSPSHMHSLRLTETHTYINKAQWIELWSNTSMNTPNWSSLLYKKRGAGAVFFCFCFSLGDTSMYRFLEEMDHCSCLLHHHHNLPQSAPILAKCLVQPVQLYPAQGQKNKSTKLHVLPLHMVKTTSCSLSPHDQNQPLSFVLPAVHFNPSRMFESWTLSLYVFPSLEQQFAFCYLLRFIDSRAERIGKQGMAWTYLGLQYKIFPATPSAVLATKGFFVFFYTYIEVLFLLGQLNILELIFVCCRVRWISSGRWRVTVLPLSSQQIVWTFSSGCTRVTVSVSAQEADLQPTPHYVETLLTITSGFRNVLLAIHRTITLLFRGAFPNRCSRWVGRQWRTESAHGVQRQEARVYALQVHGYRQAHIHTHWEWYVCLCD